MSSITPTVGRKVWFYEAESPMGLRNDDTTPFDATILYVHEDATVTLHIIDHHGQMFTKVVELRDPQDGDKHGLGIATWMPYQVSQVKPA